MTDCEMNPAKTHKHTHRYAIKKRSGVIYSRTMQANAVHLYLIKYKKVSYRKQIACQHSWSLVNRCKKNFVAFRLCKIWLLFRTGGRSKHSGDDGALPPWEGSVADTLESPDSPICVITPNFVALRQTIWA